MKERNKVMEDKQGRQRKVLDAAIKLVLSLGVFFPIYALLYLTFPASILAFYLISAVLFAVFAPWDKLKEKFLS